MTTSSPSAPRVYGHFVDDGWLAGAESIERRDPSTGRLVARFSQGTEKDVRAALVAARTAFDEGSWPLVSGQERSRTLTTLASLMKRDADKLARIEAEEVGKPIRQARADVENSIGLTEYAAALALTMHGEAHNHLGRDLTGLVMREPCGVVGMITPWNFPLLQLMQKMPFALAAGCTAICKPSELTSGTTLEMAALAREAGLPHGVFNVVTGSGSVVGSAIATSSLVDMMSFTGSTTVGRSIIGASQNTINRVSLELGGKGATVVFADADLDDALDAAIYANVFNNGECCVSGTRLLIEESVADDFVSRLTRRLDLLKVGDPLAEDTDIGPMIHEAHLEKVLSMIHNATEAGSSLIAGGQRLNGAAYDAGYFVAPTVIDRVSPETQLFREEVFGPVLAVTRFRGTEQALQLANAVDYGLANSVWTKNIDRAWHVAKHLRSGTVWINTTIDGAPQLPSGGVRSSGYGREMGQAGFDEFTELKTIQMRTAGWDRSIAGRPVD